METKKSIKTFAYIHQALEKDVKIYKGFDRDLDFKVIRDKLINEYKKLIEFDITNAKGELSKIFLKKVLYLTIAMIQLRNGSRISEAAIAFRLFLSDPNKEMVLVQISKSQSIKFNKKEDKYIETKPRYRDMMFPVKWLGKETLELLVINYQQYIFPKLSKKQTNYSENELKLIETTNKSLRKSVLQYLLDNFECNTNSLRYAFINYMISKEKRPLNEVAKFVGHKNVNMLVTYTQNKNMKEIFDLSI
jgi:integrase